MLRDKFELNISFHIHSGWIGAIFYSTGIGLVLKLIASALQQKMIGENLSHFVSIRQFVSVNSNMMRAMKLVLKRHGLSVSKVAILIGGPGRFVSQSSIFYDLISPSQWFMVSTQFYAIAMLYSRLASECFDSFLSQDYRCRKLTKFVYFLPQKDISPLRHHETFITSDHAWHNTSCIPNIPDLFDGCAFIYGVVRDRIWKSAISMGWYCSGHYSFPYSNGPIREHDSRRLLSWTSCRQMQRRDRSYWNRPRSEGGGWPRWAYEKLL